MKLLIVGTHPCHTTGYSKVMVHIIKGILENTNDVDVTVFGMQKYYTTTENTRTFQEHPRLNIYDVLEHDKEDYGYGTQTFHKFLDILMPDVVLIYNDIYVSTQFVRIIEQSRCNPKIVVYLDQIYKRQREDLVYYLNNHVDHVIAFSEYWKQNARENNIDEPITVVRHCIEVLKHYDKEEAREKLNIPQNVFIFLNLNRNQVRKRPDLTIQGYVKFLKANPNADTLLIMGNVTDGSYDLKSIYDYECMRLGVKPKDTHFLLNQNRMTDEEVNLLYCACDVGINTAQGEGYGLCNYEHAWHGKPQIVSHVGGLRDWFTEENSIPLFPVVEVHGTWEDSCIVELGEIVSTDDICDAMEKYYHDRGLYEKHASFRPPTGWTEAMKKLVSVLKNL